MTSSVSPARSADSSSSGIVHHAASNGEATTATFRPSARATDVQRQTRDADHCGEQDAAAQVAAEAGEIQPDPPQGVLPGLPQQEDDQRHQRQREDDSEELVEDVPEDLGVPIGIQLRLLLADRRRAERGAHQREHRVQSGLPDGDRQDDADLPPQAERGRSGQWQTSRFTGWFGEVILSDCHIHRC